MTAHHWLTMDNGAPEGNVARSATRTDGVAAYSIWALATLLAVGNLSGLTEVSWWIVGVFAAFPALAALVAVAVVTAALLAGGD